MEKVYEEVFEKSEQAVSAFIHDSLLCIYFLNPDTKKVIYANPAFFKSLGYAPEALDSLSVYDFIYHPKKEVDMQFSEVVKTKQRSIGERQWKTKNGKILNMFVNASFINSNQKKIICVSAQDITERKRAEVEKNLFRCLMDYSNDAIEVIDPATGRFLDANEKAWASLGYTRDEFLELSVPDIDPKVDHKAFLNVIVDLRKSGSMLWEGYHRRKDGSSFPVEVNIRLVRLEREYILSIVRDITGRKRAERRLIRSESSLRAIFENTNIGFLLLDVQLNVISFNKRCSELAMLVLGKELHKNDRLPDLLPESRKQPFMDQHRKVLQGETITYEILYPQMDESELWLEVNSKPVFDESKQVTGISFAITDVSSRKKTEERLVETIKEIDTFIFRSSHDLKSPVSSLKGLINLMKNDITDKKSLEYLKLVEETNIRMENILNDLSFVVLIKDKILESSVINLSELINSTIGFYKHVSGFEKIQFSVNIENGLSFFSDAALVSIICKNLINNAIIYRIRTEGHTVSISAEKRHFGVFFTVSDNGEGISEESKKRIFEVFYRGNLKSAGTGLGLYIVKKAAEKLGGFIRVRSELLKGTEFKVFLPAGEKEKVLP